MSTVTAAPGSTLISFEYNDDVYGEPGMVWAILHDNAVLAWIVDDAGTAPVKPVILGTLVDDAPDTGDIKSPAWAVREGSTIFIPDMARGSAHELFNFIAFNNGAKRPLYAKFADSALAYEYNQWAAANPTMSFKNPPNVAPDAP